MQKIGARLLAAFRWLRQPLIACSLLAGIAIAGTGSYLTVKSLEQQPIAPATESKSAEQSPDLGCSPPAIPPSGRNAVNAPASRTTDPVQSPEPQRPFRTSQPTVAPHPKWANFAGEPGSRSARQLADWVADSRDNRGMPFAIIDKANAKVFVFDAFGRLRGAAPILLGFARGDYSVPGIGDRKLSDIRSDERTTPAGRFVSYLGLNAKRTDVLWVDYKNAVSLHRVITNNPSEHRLERLSTPDAIDKRISYGCINVPAAFFDRVVKPAFARTYGVVYVLPETLTIGQVFKTFYDVEARWGAATVHVDEHPAPEIPVPATPVRHLKVPPVQAG